MWYMQATRRLRLALDFAPTGRRVELDLLLQEYEDKAVELGLNHSKRLGLRQRLKDVRLSCPLFDTTQWVKDLEKIYFKMWDIHCEGQGPRTFDVV